MTWEVFLAFLAQEVGTQTQLLNVASMKWRWMKPATAETLPINSANGFSSMVKQIVASRAQSPYVFLYMKPPSTVKETPTVCYLYLL